MITAALKILPAFTLVFAIASSSYAADLNKPSYWISRLEEPDRAVLTPEEIKEFNRLTLEKTDQMADLFSMPETVSGEKLNEWLLYDPIPDFKNVGKRYDYKGRKIKEDSLKKLSENMNLNGVNESNAVRFGVIVERADIRAFPTDEPVFKRPGTQEFDTLQYSSAYPPEAVALLHKSSDGQWGFFQTGTVRGWIRLSKVAFGDKEGVTSSGDDFVVATGSKVRVFADKKFKKALLSVPMGTVLYLSDGNNNDDNFWTVRFPQRSSGGALAWAEGFVRKSGEISRGFLPYTGRNVITQAFRMLGEEYGWGGKDGKRDCSEFIKDLFATMGVKLPRNSRQQRNTGVILASTDETFSREEIVKALKEARPGITLLGLDRHIMLYLGDNNGKPYAIHQVFGYKDGTNFKVVNRVAVTGLNLERRARTGTFKSRIKSVTEVLVPRTDS